MRKFTLICWAAGLLATARAAAPEPPAAGFISVPAADAPELAKRGALPVGVRTVQLIHRGQVDILHVDKQTGQAPRYDRPLTVEVWYPAEIPAGEREETTYRMPVPGGRGFNGQMVFEIPDKALRDAPPRAGATYPLVIVSHGYPGSRYFMTYLDANLASKGYIVAAIDHTDSVFDDMRDFSSTLLNRSNDQWFTIDSLVQLSHETSFFLNGILNEASVAIVGYSMGGYGALTSAGAGYAADAGTKKLVPGGYLGDWQAGSARFVSHDRSRLKAIVAIAPWGNQPPFSAWNAGGLAGIQIPSLFIAGDHDDVADFAHGIKPAFEEAVHSDRCLLVYENALHNTGGNPAPQGVELPYPLIQSFDDPVWRKDRITSINQHFITAFLDLYLKGDQSKLAYLRVSPARSNDGVWPKAYGEQDSGAYSTGRDAQGNLFWKGFQRRDALGLEMTCRSPGR